jgi:hypothetical protein
MLNISSSSSDSSISFVLSSKLCISCDGSIRLGIYIASSFGGGFDSSFGGGGVPSGCSGLSFNPPPLIYASYDGVYDFFYYLFF